MFQHKSTFLYKKGTAKGQGWVSVATCEHRTNLPMASICFNLDIDIEVAFSCSMIVCLLFGGNLINAISKHHCTWDLESRNVCWFSPSSSDKTSSFFRRIPTVLKRYEWSSCSLRGSIYFLVARTLLPEVQLNSLTFRRFQILPTKFRLSKVMVDTTKVSQCKFPLVCNVRIQKLQERIQLLMEKALGKSPLIWIPKHNVTAGRRGKNHTNAGKRWKTLLLSVFHYSASIHCAVEDWCPRNQDDAFSWWRNLDESLRPEHTWRRRPGFSRLLFESVMGSLVLSYVVKNAIQYTCIIFIYIYILIVYIYIS